MTTEWAIHKLGYFEIYSATKEKEKYIGEKMSLNYYKELQASKSILKSFYAFSI